MAGFNFDKINEGIQRVANAAQALTGGADTITIRHTGLTVQAPYAGNENRTVLEILRAYGGEVGIPAGANPAVTSPGVGAVDTKQKVQGGQTYEAFTDKKNNA